MRERSQPGKRPPAPGRLALVQSFVNTNNIEDEEDDFSSLDGFRGWLESKRLIAESDKVSDAERRNAIELREALRALALANNDAPLERAAIHSLNRQVDRLPLAVRFRSDGVGGLIPEAAGVRGALAEIVGRVYAAMEAGNWERLKACQNLGCRWVFYDHSKNHSGRWCTMKVCGNRFKARAYIARQRGARRPRRS